MHITRIQFVAMAMLKNVLKLQSTTQCKQSGHVPDVNGLSQWHCVRVCIDWCWCACVCDVCVDWWCAFCYIHEQSDEVAIPPAGSVSVLSERQSRVLCELEERVNNLEQRANTIFADNAQQQAEFTRLKERLVEALESEVNLHLL